jgi:hypothetical protein
MSEALSADAIPYTPAGLRKAGIRPAPSAATLHRWRLRGLRGIRVLTFLRGGRRYVTPSALAEFFDALTVAADGTTSLPASFRRARHRGIAQAEAELDADEI